LRHEYFKNLPRPTNPAKLPKPILDRESKKRQDQNGLTLLLLSIKIDFFSNFSFFLFIFLF